MQMPKYILEIIDRDGAFIECLHTQYVNGTVPAPDTTADALKAEIFNDDELDNMDWVYEHIVEHFGTMVKVVRVIGEK